MRVCEDTGQQHMKQRGRCLGGCCGDAQLGCRDSLQLLGLVAARCVVEVGPAGSSLLYVVFYTDRLAYY